MHEIHDTHETHKPREVLWALEIHYTTWTTQKCRFSRVLNVDAFSWGQKQQAALLGLIASQSGFLLALVDECMEELSRQ